jgi:hypothetical protein
MKPFFIIAPDGNPYQEFDRAKRQWQSISNKQAFEVFNPPRNRHPLQHAAMLTAQAQRITPDGPAGLVYGPDYLVFFGLSRI